MRLIGLAATASLLTAFVAAPALGQASVAVPPSPPPLIDSDPEPETDPVELPGGQQPSSSEVAPAAAPAPQPAPDPINVVNAPVEGAETQQHQDWALECFEETDTCQITHRVLAAEGSQTVIVVALYAAEDAGPAQLQIAVPLGVSTTAGVRLAIGPEYQANIPISRCTPQGCLVEGTASDTLLAAMRQGRQGQLSVVNDAGATIDLPFSLMGFTAAYANMIGGNQAD
ncbi:invasion associated locus B family protein [Pelagibacterium luteolum]|uniref:Invasion protein IalB, involved in pathogenesis n=1 Tax=Pelagibacterium luteolum TaxID=440168 RepID=A0A1G7SW23_9HYPH|nr:invasion associated locus B family protein [Pelagibacterium luteolum]SDG27253.1 Invasion protein IalB, involved in pathogenesis [Pelagibacterium luteolum]